jgi:chromosome segregation ATPase
VLEALNAQLIEENDEFYRDVENYALAQQNLDRQVSTLDQEIAAYRAANEALRQQAREELASALERSTFLEERLSAMELSVEETSQQLARSLDRSAFLEERLIGSDASLEEAKQDLAGSLDRSNSLEQQLETASQDLAKSLERVTAMESSTSWKLTKPLRILSDAVRRFSRRAR